MQDGATVAYPDTCVGTDSHTTMINGLGVLGWGVGGIEAEAAMLGQPVSMLIPEVVGFKLTGSLAEGITATDLVLTCDPDAACAWRGRPLCRILWPGSCLADPRRPRDARQYGARIWRDLRFLSASTTRRSIICASRVAAKRPIALAEAYAKEQGFWIDPSVEPIFSSTLELDMSSGAAEPCRAEAAAGQGCALSRSTMCSTRTSPKCTSMMVSSAFRWKAKAHDIGDGDVVIAAITSVHEYELIRACWSLRALSRKRRMSAA